MLLTMTALSAPIAAAAAKPSFERPRSLALHEHGLLNSAQTGGGIDKDLADELIRRSGCRVNVSVMSRGRTRQLIETGALDLSLSGVTSEARDRFAAFAWYESNRFYLLVRKDAGVKSLAEFEGNPALTLGAIRRYRCGPIGNRFVDSLDDAHRVTFASTPGVNVSGAAR